MSFPEYLTALALAVPRTPIIVSGPLTLNVKIDIPNLRLLRSLEDMLKLTGNFE
jgi:hypothetical protein